MLQAPVLAAAGVVAVAVAVHLQLHPGTCRAATRHPWTASPEHTCSLSTAATGKQQRAGLR